MVSVDKEKCIGCGSCAAVAPEIFEIVDGKAVLKKQPQTKEEKTKANEAKEICPVDAIR